VVKTLEHQLSRRERQIMDVLFQHGRATVAEVQDGLVEPTSYSSVRKLLRVLEEKGFVSHVQDGPRYVYRATIGKERARRSALRRLRDTFFNGSSEQVMAALLDDASRSASAAELDRLAELIDRARSADKGEKQ
jgi:BlaI family transcriptional regulator, penicillinase repressor